MPDKHKKTAVKCLKWFIVFLLAITYFSRTIYNWTLPRVTLGFPERDNFYRLSENGSGFDHFFYDYVLPTSAIMSNGRDYVFILMEQNGPMGREFVVARENVVVLDRWRNRVAVEINVGRWPVVFGSDRELSEGMSVRFYP